MKNKGFTLIELLVAIIIIAILGTAMITLSNPLGQLGKARDAERKSDLDQVQKALEIYYNDNNRYPLEASGKINDKKITDSDNIIEWGNPWLPYMQTLPKDPLASQSYIYKTYDNGASYRIYAKIENCVDGVNTLCLEEYNYFVSSPNAPKVAYTVLLTGTPTPTPTNTPTPTPTPTYRRVFVTSTIHDGNLGGLSGADNKCKLLADNSSITSVRGKTWRAWLSDSSNSPALSLSPRIFTKSTVPYKLVDGTTVVADDWDNLKDGGISHAIDMDESGNIVGGGGSFVWTNTKTDGNIKVTTATCEEWTSFDNTLSNPSGGNYKTINNQWTDDGIPNCVSSQRLYCFEQ